MYNEVFKIFGDFKTPSFDFNKLFDMQRRNIEAFTQANQVFTESVQAIARHQAELVRNGVDDVLKASKGLVSGGASEVTVEKQAALSKAMIEKSLANAREVSEMISKSSFEAFDLLNKRAAESFEEFGKTASSGKK